MAGGVPTWEEVAREHGRFLYNVAYRLAGNDSDAQDLVQESLLRVRKGLERYQPGSLEGWLARIVTNVFLDEVRRRKRRPADALPDDPDWVLPPAPAADEVSTGFSDEVQAALATLPDEFRAAVVLCDVVDLPYDEIAESLGVPVGTVRSRIHGRRRLVRNAHVGAGRTASPRSGPPTTASPPISTASSTPPSVRRSTHISRRPPNGAPSGTRSHTPATRCADCRRTRRRPGSGRASSRPS